jgi:hypothetical protein
MKSPRAPGAGNAGARKVSLGGELSKSVAEAGTFINDNRARSAAVLDRRADLLLTAGLHVVAERLAHHAAEIRAVRP